MFSGKGDKHVASHQDFRKAKHFVEMNLEDLLTSKQLLSIVVLDDGTFALIGNTS